MGKLQAIDIKILCCWALLDGWACEEDVCDWVRWASGRTDLLVLAGDVWNAVHSLLTAKLIMIDLCEGQSAPEYHLTTKGEAQARAWIGEMEKARAYLMAMEE